jgi:hypothetical protein
VWYENTGTQAKPVMTYRGAVLQAKLAGHNPTPNAADWNGDGRLDLLVGAEDGFFYYFEAQLHRCAGAFPGRNPINAARVAMVRRQVFGSVSVLSARRRSRGAPVQ